MHECSILFSTAGVGYPAGYVRRYLRPRKFIRDAPAKDAQDSVSGLHECGILLSTTRGNLPGTHARRPPGAGYPRGMHVVMATRLAVSRGVIVAQDHRRGYPRRRVTFGMYVTTDVQQRCLCHAHTKQPSMILRRGLGG